MEWLTAGCLIIVGLLVLLAIGMPIACALGLLSVVVLFFVGGKVALGAVASIAFDSMTSFVLNAAPLFILMAEVLFIGGIGGELYDVASLWLRRLNGGLAIATTAACAIFGAMCGVSIAAAATIGSVAIPEMRQRGYDDKLAVGSVAGAASLAILIPPSVPMIIYAVVSDQSVGKLFIAGIIPGVMLTLIYIGYIVLRVKMNPTLAPRAKEVSWKERMLSLRRIWSGLILIIAVLGAIYTGVATPTEAAAVGALASFVVVGLRRRLSWHSVKAMALGATRTTSAVLIIVVGAMIFGYTLSLLEIPQHVSAWAMSMTVPPWIVIIFINLVLIVMGMFLDVGSCILLSSPIFVPIVSGLGYDLVWYGIMLTINMEMAVITPPVGLNLFVIQGIVPDVPLADIIRGSMPYVVLDCIAIALLVIFPQLALWLPGHM